MTPYTAVLYGSYIPERYLVPQKRDGCKEGSRHGTVVRALTPPPMWPGFEFPARHHMPVEFVVVVLVLTPRVFSPGYFVLISFFLRIKLFLAIISSNSWFLELNSPNFLHAP